ncbi:MAG: hypothetical protein KDI47_09595 [Gammaproteobacteria bacterium]|nr:hypothetical protein [Gammaproteobacteria bacterium]MCB1873203.1 hypothetical protein [Gammaproteobacteria bacterium]MCB1881278.1 hypothetical protein [Gammaproteobacteria bacterium]MCB1903820.1 hypothetical protein [Gammaproteobacteria bacterium]
MSRENDRISTNVDCIDIVKLPATLISVRGAHCKVFQTAGIRRRKSAPIRNFVLKMHVLACSKREAEIYHRDYRKMRKQLKEIIPYAMFVRTRINGEPNLLVIAYAYTPWFNIANPANEAEALPLLGKHPRACLQLEYFVAAAKQWREQEGKVIDLWGIDNLVLDKDRQIRYLDSFEVFFYEDMLHIMDNAGRELEEKITISLQRLDYLDYLVQQNKKS